MTLTAGSRLGSYEIIAAIGAGGMGEVYRARDSKLGRDVALKVLPDLFASDPDRLTRFEREAKALAALSHPNIAALFGTEAMEARHFLVMELVEGPTLAERIERGTIPVEEVLRIALQIAEALEAAHEKGIVHRDLKPANVKIGADDRVKVLDFGLARIGAAEKTAAGASLTRSPTLSMLATEAGVILGTPAYMSPEQAKGLPADHRSDVFSFGIVLFELLTGRQPFQGETAPDTMASILAREADLAALPPGLNPRLVELLKRCLEKQPRKRWQAIGDLRVELESLVASPYRTETPASAAFVRTPLWKRALPVAAGVALTAATTTVATRWLTSPRPANIVRFSFPAPDFLPGVAGITISPDGSRLVYAGTTGVDQSQLMIRNLSEADVRPIAGTAIRGAITAPVFSPDGQFVAYYSAAEGSLKKIAVTGGTAVTLCALGSRPNGNLSWRGDTIFVAQADGIVKVPANGGEPQLAVRIDAGSLVASPQPIDDRGSILFALSAAFGSDGSRWDKAQIVLQTTDGSRHVLVSGGADPHYVTTGHLVYALGGSLLAVPFDPARLRIVGGPTPVVEGVTRSATGAAAAAAVSSDGALVYVPGPSTASSARTLGLIDVRDGKVHPLPIPPNAYTQPRVSPDGRLVAVASDDGTEGVIWIFDMIDRGPPRRLTFGGHSTSPVWTPDGRFVTYSSDQQGERGLFLQRADGTGPVERLTKADPSSEHFPDSWSPDGRILAYRVQLRTSSVWTVARDGDRTPKPLLQMKDRSLVGGAFSPDGRWIAYGSTELNGVAYQVFVQPFPADGTKYQAERQSGSMPVWSRDSKRLFFSYTNHLFVVEVRTSPTFSAGQPVEVAGTGGTLGSLPAVRNFDLMPDGNQLLAVFLDSTDDRKSTDRGLQIAVALNWTEELKQRVPTR
jgi:serine/threonine-protein kinase